jgi:hypothetical protein
MKKIVNYLLFYSIFACIATSCQKDEIGKTAYSPDATAPTILILSPANDAIGGANTVVIRGTISDNKELHSAHLGIRAAGSATEIWSNEPYVHDLESFDLDVAVGAGVLTAGQNYVLTVTAEDHNENSRTVIVQFSVV